ncbi:hypothetical protein JG687_00000482, partial [Phytophthora cactorum]
CRDHRRRDSDGFHDIECRSRADSRVLLRCGRGGETRGLLNKLRGSTVSAVCSAYYALTDTEFCSEMIRLHQLGEFVQVIIDKEWTRSCKVGLECVMALMATGIPDAMVALGGSANMTKAAWSKNDEFIFHVEGPAAYQAQARFNALLE